MKTALVVGGAGALGAATVRELLDRGLSFAVAGRGPSPDRRVRCSYRIDPTSADWSEVYAKVEDGLAAPLDAVVFVSGTAVFGRTGSIPLDRARQTFELNFWACAQAATAAAAHWTERARAGTFAAVLSIAGRRAVPFEAYYSASKSATARFLECLDLEHADRNVRFVCAYPGTIATPFRSRAEWYGLEAHRSGGGADVHRTARAVVDLLNGRRKSTVIGWRERTIDLADRLWPGLYDRAVLRRRVSALLGSSGEPAVSGERAVRARRAKT
jgi:NAD(P)-dependent dehydrogenase (short-subunit alcohol dehydrogenase family)